MVEWAGLKDGMEGRFRGQLVDESQRCGGERRMVARLGVGREKPEGGGGGGWVVCAYLQLCRSLVPCSVTESS